MKIKACPNCKIKKPPAKFYKDAYAKSGLSSYCKDCKNVIASESTYKYKNSERGFLQNRLCEMFTPNQIKRRGLVPECTKDEIKKYFYEYVEKHGRNCFYCKEPWTYVVNKYIPGNGKGNSDKGKSRIGKIKNLSFDRLDSSKTYSIDNIIFCCTQCNLSKKDISINLIKRLYEIITERNL